MQPISAARLPWSVLEEVFSWLALPDVGRCGRVCRQWAACLEREDGRTWEALAGRGLPDAALGDPFLLADLPSAKARLRAYAHAWNPLDCSKNSFVKLNGFTLHRNPIAQSTDGARGRRGFQSGRHAWEVWWEGPLGTVAVVGLATRHAALQCPGYTALLGSDDQGWGWNLVDQTFLHNGLLSRELTGAPLAPPPAPDAAVDRSGASRAPAYAVGEKIRLVLDCDAHLLYLEKGSEFLGVAFRDLPPLKLYPSVCAVYGNTEVSMVYLGPPLDG